MTESLCDNGYPRSPRNMPDGTWFYEDPDGIIVVIGGSQTTIPWRKIEAAVRHHHAAKAKR